MNNREAFEAWYQNEYVQFGRANFHFNSYGEYFDDDIEASWCAWQAALASQQDHIGENNKLVQSVNVLAAQTGESPESITEWLTDKGGLTQLMLSHFGGMSSQAQQTESQWISVEERLPEDNSTVMAADQWGNIQITFYTENHDYFNHTYGYKLNRKDHGKYSKRFEWARKYPTRITHWMPLPPAPEGDKP